MERHRTRIDCLAAVFFSFYFSLLSLDYHNRFTRSHITNTMYYLKAFKQSNSIRVRRLGIYEYGHMTEVENYSSNEVLIVCVVAYSSAFSHSPWSYGHYYTLHPASSIALEVAKIETKAPCEWGTISFDWNAQQYNRLKFDQIRERNKWSDDTHLNSHGLISPFTLLLLQRNLTTQFASQRQKCRKVKTPCYSRRVR